MTRKDWTITESSTRPNGKSDECFYCKNKLGEQHKEDCVIRNKTVVIDFTIRTTIDVPEFWDEEFINFRYNESSWCADNLLSELDNRNEETGRCLCEITTAKYIKEADEEDELDYGYRFVNELES